jgi:ABC-type transport system involved in multi-copper enzyme maturation permease subunit
MFSQILSLSHLTFMGLSHKKIYFVGLSIGALLTLLSLLLGPLGFEEEKRLSINFGLAGAQVGAIFLAVLSGATLLKEELENQSAFIFLSKDISRTQYLISKFIGFVYSLLVTLGILSGFFYLTSFLTGLDWSLNVFIPFSGIFVEALILFCFSLLISLVTSSLLTVGLSFCFFMITHWVQTLEHLIKEGSAPFLKIMGPIISWTIPNLESLNWKSHLTYNEWYGPSYYILSLSYGMLWVVIFLCISILVFNKKDLS